MREIKFIAPFTQNPDGSVLACFGNTKVLCTAMIEEGVPAFLKGSEKGWLTAEYSMLPGSTQSRNPRDITRGKLQGRSSEIQRLIGRSLRMALDLSLLGERTVYIDCDVLQADGGTRTTAISGAFVALQLAVDKLLKEKKLLKNPIVRQIAAVSVGIVGEIYEVDLDYSQDSQADVDMNLVMDSQKNLIEIQGTAERSAFSVEQLLGLIDKAWGALNIIFKEQERTYEQNCISDEK